MSSSPGDASPQREMESLGISALRRRGLSLSYIDLHRMDGMDGMGGMDGYKDWSRDAL
jgi:hypothetical protein